MAFYIFQIVLGFVFAFVLSFDFNTKVLDQENFIRVMVAWAVGMVVGGILAVLIFS